MARAYLDNSATTRPCAAAVAAMTKCLEEGWYNPSSVYKPSVEVFRQVRGVREQILDSVHGAQCDLYFTSGGTEANNLAILGAVERMRGRQVVALSAVEHPSVLAAFERLSQLGHNVRYIGVSRGGELDWDALERALDDGASLVSVMQVNNETGWLLGGEGSWTNYSSDEVDAALALSQELTDVNEITAQYLIVDRAMQQDAAMISGWVIGTLGARNNRLLNAEPNVFGTFVNVTEWDVQ